MSSDGPTPAHPDLTALVAPAVGASDDAPELDEVLAAHLRDCPSCRERQAAVLAAVGALATLPPEHAPSAVADRWEAAVNAAARDPLGRGRTARDTARGARAARFASRPWPGLAAAAAAVLLVSGLVVGALRAGAGGGRASGSSAAAGSAGSHSAAALPSLGTYPLVLSPSNYTAATLPGALSTLLGSGQRAAAAPAAASAAPSPADSNALASGATAGVAPLPAATFARLRTSAGMATCLAALGPGARPVRTPLAAEFARYNGAPAAILVQPDPTQATSVLVWVVGPRCGVPTAGANLIAFRVLPRP